MEAYNRAINLSQVASKAAARKKVKDEKKTKVDKYADTSGFSPSSSKEFVIVRRNTLTKNVDRKSSPGMNQQMISISNYVRLFGVDKELENFLINDCAGKIPARLGEDISFKKPQLEMPINTNKTKEELTEWSSDEEPPPKRKKLVTNTTTLLRNSRKSSSERNEKRNSSPCNKFKSKRKRQRSKNKIHRKRKVSPPTEHHETELSMAEAVKLLSKGVISVSKPNLDCDVPKEVDTKRSQQDADHNIIEIIDELSSMSGYSVIINETDQIPIMVESEDDETPDIPKRETNKTVNRFTMTEKFPSPMAELEQISDIRQLSKEIKNKTPGSFSSDVTEINRRGLVRPCSTKRIIGESNSDSTETKENFTLTCIDLSKDDQETITRTASNGRLQMDSYFLNIFTEKSNAQLNQTDMDPNLRATTEENFSRVNLEALFNLNRISTSSGATIDESLKLTNVDTNLADSTVTANTNLHRKSIEASPTVDTKYTSIKCLLEDPEIIQLTNELYELIERRSTSGITSSTDRNQSNNATTARSTRCAVVKEMLFEELQQMVKKFYTYTHSESRTNVDCLSDVLVESTGLSGVDDQNIVPESLPISADSSENLTNRNNSREAEEVTPACSDTTKCITQITDDKSRLENDSSLRDIEMCSDNQNSVIQSPKIHFKKKAIKSFQKKNIPKKKILILKKTLKAEQRAKKKPMASRALRKKIGTHLLKNDLQGRLRKEKNFIDRTNVLVGTVANDKSFSNCNEINKDDDLSESSTESAKLEDIVKNSSELIPATKHPDEEEINYNESSEVKMYNIPTTKRCENCKNEEMKQLLIFVNVKIIMGDPVEGVSTTTNPSKTTHDSSHLSESKDNLFNPEKKTNTIIQLESDKIFHETLDNVTTNKNNPERKLPKEVEKKVPTSKPKRRTSQSKDKKMRNVQIRPAAQEWDSAVAKSKWQLKQLKVVCERYPFKIENKNAHKNNTTTQEEHCDSTTAIVEKGPEISNAVETCISQATVACNTDAEYFKPFPLFYSEPTEVERLTILNDWQSKTPLENIDDIIEINNTEVRVNDDEFHLVNNEMVSVEENPITEDDVTKILKSNFSIAEIQKEVEPISGPSSPHHKTSHLPVIAAPTVQETATRIAQPLCEPNNMEKIGFQSKLPNLINVEYEKLVFDTILNTETSAGVEDREEYNVVQYVPKHNPEEVEMDLVETLSKTSCDNSVFDLQPINTVSTIELESVIKSNSDVISDSQLVNMSSVNNEAISETLSNTKYGDQELVSSTTCLDKDGINQTTQPRNTDLDAHSKTLSNSTNFDITADSNIKPPQKNMDCEKHMNSNNNYCDTDFQNLVIEENSTTDDQSKTQSDNKTNRETATFRKTNPADRTPDSSHITASEYILRKQQKSSYIDLNATVSDPRLKTEGYPCFEEIVKISEANKMKLFKSFSAEQVNLPQKKIFKKRDEKELRKIVYIEDETNIDNRLKLLTNVDEHMTQKLLTNIDEHMMTQKRKKKEKMPTNKKIEENSVHLLSDKGKIPESSPNTRLHSAPNTLSSSSFTPGLPPLEPQSINSVLDPFSDGTPQMCPPPLVNPQPLDSIQLMINPSLFSKSGDHLREINSSVLPTIKSLDSLSSSLLHSFNPAFNQNATKELQSSKINDSSYSELSRMSTSEFSLTNTHSSSLSFTQKAMADQLGLKNKVESTLQLEKPFPKELTVSLWSKDMTYVRQSDQPSVTMQSVSNNQINLPPVIRDPRMMEQEAKTIYNAQKRTEAVEILQKLGLEDIRKKQKNDNAKQREDNTLLTSIQNTQVQRKSNPYYVESNPNNTREIGATESNINQNNTKGGNRKYATMGVAKSQLHNLREDIIPQREGLDLSKSCENTLEADVSTNKTNLTGMSYRSYKEGDKTLKHNSKDVLSLNHYYRKRLVLPQDGPINPPPGPPPPPPPPNQINQPSDAQQTLAQNQCVDTHCGLQETHLAPSTSDQHPVTREPSYPTYRSVPLVPQYYDTTVSRTATYPICPNSKMATNNLHRIPHNNNFESYQVYHGNPNNHDRFPSYSANPVPNYQHSPANLQSIQSSQSQVTDPYHHFINPSQTVGYNEIPQSTHSNIPFPPPQRNMNPNMYARSYNPWINPICPQGQTTFPPLDAQKQQFLQNYSKRVKPPPPEGLTPRRIPQRRSSMYQ